MARTLQAGLRRAGCYNGSVNGSWGPESRQAMTRFLSAVNAALPVSEPDEVLVALIEAKRDVICTKEQMAARPRPPSGGMADGSAVQRVKPASDRERRDEPRDRRWASEPRSRGNVFQQLFGGG
jgi:peptidoglycan hydrolase-like protein with peptidoglycan-binding domain